MNDDRCADSDRERRARAVNAIEVILVWSAGMVFGVLCWVALIAGVASLWQRLT